MPGTEISALNTVRCFLQVLILGVVLPSSAQHHTIWPEAVGKLLSKL